MKANTFVGLPATAYKIDWGLAQLRALREDLELGFLGDFELQVAARLSSGLLSDAESLLEEATPQHIEHVLAGVLAGIVLEQGIREMCQKRQPPVAVTRPDGTPEKLNTLIDRLKDSGLYSELVAKQLRAHYAMRNQLAHGDFAKIDKAQVR